MIKSCLIVFCISFAFVLKGQHSVVIGLDLGKIVKHKKELLYETPLISYGIIIDHKYDFNHRNSSVDFWGNPRLNNSLGVFSFGDKEVLGVVYYLMTGLEWKVYNGPNVSIRSSFQSGLAYLNNKFNRVTNPTNNAIGSHLNNATKFGLSVAYATGQSSHINLSSYLLHFSNGLNVSPNSGINTFLFSIGFERTLGKKSIPEIESKKTLNPKLKKHGIAFMLALGKKQNAQNFGGPSFGVHYYRLDYIYRRKTFHHFSIGFSHEYDGAKYQFEKDVFTPENDAKDKAKRSAFVLGNQMLLGRFTLGQSIGAYLPIIYSRGDDPIYFLLSTEYKLLELKNLSLNLGVQLKTHFSVADYISYSARLAF